jgi:DNA-binding response OmpR family regulator
MHPPDADDAATSKKPPLRLWLPQLLVMEDIRKSRVLLETTLDKGYCVDTARTLQDVMRMARIRPYDGIILDVARTSPHLNSHVLHQLRQMERYEDAPILAITDGPVTSVLGTRETMWFDGYLSKPFSERDVIKLLDNFFWHPDFFPGD